MFKFSDNSGDRHKCLGVEHVPDIVLVGRNRESGDIGSFEKCIKFTIFNKKLKNKQN